VDVKITAEGELLVRGPTVAPMETGEDGWLHTGDLGWEDEDGHLWIRGRLSDVIISGGVNIHPGEVQGILEAHPRIREAVVFGLEDDEWGERVAAGVVCEGSSSVSEEEVRAWVRERLSGAKTPRAIRRLPAIPRNANGKVDRDRLRAYFQ
jgi:O-succinylbenzoic acid--CoA ligase